MRQRDTVVIDPSLKKTLRLVVLGIVLFFVATALFSCFKIIDTGYRGVKTRFGEVVGGTLGEGLYFVNPVTTKIRTLDVRIKKGVNKTSTYSKDAQIVDVVSTANFYLQKDKVHVVYPTYGVDWQNKIITHTLEGTIKEVTGQYQAVELISDREKAVQSIRAGLEKKLAAQNVVLTHFEINNLDFDDKFEEAVKNKVIAVEQAKEAQNKTIKIEEEAKQRVISAKAEAESMRIRSQALSANKSLVEYEAVQKWNGVLPQYTMGGSVPFINLKTK